MEELSGSKENDVDDVGGGCSSPPTPHHRGPAAAAEAEARCRYHECLRNHAAAAGGHVVDGCGEFMPASAEEPLACAACGCHRSFHRRDPSPGRAGAGHLLPLHMLPASIHSRAPALRLPPPAAAASRQGHPPFPGYVYGTPSGGTGTTTASSSEERLRPSPAPAARRRSRTTFTREQKERMLAFADRVGWRIQRQEEAAVEHFCAQAGVRRQALKVWMHNNKHSFKQKQQQLQENRQEHQQ
ncbi:zinc-finger homeodomain protein 5-like [Oryza brachyantha]|uniref:zinc-finger homeodomain protein 5-like n=1 Tax=Oryza brachyantha TaxID=4533 RepID=UPI001ADA428C|nr:zinc-finger homeodomain protein 5-like [Oryza brachyantha]